MEIKAAKKVLKLIKFPMGKTTSIGDIAGNCTYAQWTKRGGYAGADTINKVLDAAKAAGWKPEERSSSMSPDGNVASSSQALVSPEGIRVTYHRSYGATKYNNWFQLDVKFPS